MAPATKPLIVIDPGHGGRDSGAVGIAGTLEKRVTLTTALELRRLLLATGHYRVLLTRATDRFVSLADRVAFERSHHTALFISIHADSSPDHQAHGASVYTRSAAASGGLAALAATSSNSGKIARVLAHARPGSSLLQYTLIDNLNDDLAMADDPARQAHLYVLCLTDIPSVLVEMGFLSNRREEAELRTAKHRLVIARAIRDAIEDYFRDLKHSMSDI